jgi:hypothetical protein
MVAVDRGQSFRSAKAGLLRRGYRVALARTSDVAGVGAGYFHSGHDVSAISGIGKQAQAAAVRTWIRIKRPVLQTGHRRDS